MIQKLCFLALAITLMAGCSTSKKAVTDDPISGTWQYEVTGIPTGDVSGSFVMAKAGDAYMGTINTSDAQVKMEDLTIEGNKLNCNYRVDGYDIVMQGDFVGDKFEGVIKAEGYDFPVTATKQEQK